MTKQKTQTFIGDSEIDTIETFLTDHLKFQTPWNRKPSRPEVNNLPSLTSPDQSLTIPQIMARFAKGLPLGGGYTPQYHGEGHETNIQDDILLGRNWDSLDLSEKHDIIKEASHDYTKIKQGQADQRAAEKTATETRKKQKAETIEKFQKYMETQK
jgi:hypothetical protein